jgi:hypothetical protein
MSLDLAAQRQSLVAALRAAGRPYRGAGENDSYTGSGHPFFNVSAPALRRVARSWLANHRAADDDDLLAVADRLFAGEVYEGKVLAAVLLGYSARARRGATPAMVCGWLTIWRAGPRSTASAPACSAPRSCSLTGQPGPR